MPVLQQITSIHGRRLGLSSTGGILASTGSTVFDSVAVMRDSTGARLSPLYEPLIAVASSVGSTITNSGVTTLSSASATAITGFELANPVAGIYKEIHLDTSASEFTIGGTSTAIVFASTLVGAGSTLFISSAAAGGGVAETVIALRGRSTAQWAVIGSTTNLTIG